MSKIDSSTLGNFGTVTQQNGKDSITLDADVSAVQTANGWNVSRSNGLSLFVSNEAMSFIDYTGGGHVELSPSVSPTPIGLSPSGALPQNPISFDWGRIPPPPAPGEWGRTELTEVSQGVLSALRPYPGSPTDDSGNPKFSYIDVDALTPNQQNYLAAVLNEEGVVTYANGTVTAYGLETSLVRMEKQHGLGLKGTSFFSPNAGSASADLTGKYRFANTDDAMKYVKEQTAAAIPVVQKEADAENLRQKEKHVRDITTNVVNGLMAIYAGGPIGLNILDVSQNGSPGMSLESIREALRTLPVVPNAPSGFGPYVDKRPLTPAQIDVVADAIWEETLARQAVTGTEGNQVHEFYVGRRILENPERFGAFS
jgi:hypothetical protein